MNKITKLVSCIVIATFLLTSTAFAVEKVFFYHTDPAGTPLAMSDESGTVVWEADYKPFGEEYDVTAFPENNKMFVGKEKDKETDLYYFGARYMRSEIGRFVSPDPVGAVDPWTSNTNYSLLGNPQRLNQYAYGLNNPYRYVDPDGNFSIRAIPQNFANSKYSFRITFRNAPKGTAGGLVGRASKNMGRSVGVAKTAGNKVIDSIGGESVSYERKGLGILQAWNESITDAVFESMLTPGEKVEFREGTASKELMLKVLKLFEGKDEYSNMNYPTPKSMIKKAMKNADKSSLGRATRAFERKLNFPE